MAVSSNLPLLDKPMRKSLDSVLLGGAMAAIAAALFVLLPIGGEQFPLSTVLGIVISHAGWGALIGWFVSPSHLEGQWSRAAIYGAVVSVCGPFTFVLWAVALNPGSILVFGALLVALVLWILVGLGPWIIIGRLWVGIVDRQVRKRSSP